MINGFFTILLFVMNLFTMFCAFAGIIISLCTGNYWHSAGFFAILSLDIMLVMWYIKRRLL